MRRRTRAAEQESSNRATNVEASRAAAAPAAPAAPTVAPPPRADDETVNLFLTDWFRLLCIGLVLHDIVAAVWAMLMEARSKSGTDVPAFALMQDLFDLTSLLSLTIALAEAVIRLMLAYKHGLSPWRMADGGILALIAYFGFWRGYRGECICAAVAVFRAVCVWDVCVWLCGM